MHVGLGARGGLCLEKRGRKENYFIPDVDGKLAPIISSSEDDRGSARTELSEQVRFEAERAASGGSSGSTPDDPRKAVKRGFADGYEEFPAEFWSELEVEKIVSHVKKSTGIEVGRFLKNIIQEKHFDELSVLVRYRRSNRPRMQASICASLSIIARWRKRTESSRGVAKRRVKFSLFMFPQLEKT